MNINIWTAISYDYHIYNSNVTKNWTRFLQPHQNVFLRQKLFHITNSVGAIVENARGEDGVGFAGEQHLGHVFQRACAAAGHDGHAYGFAHAPRDNEIKSGLGAVGINSAQFRPRRAPRHSSPIRGRRDRCPCVRRARTRPICPAQSSWRQLKPRCTGCRISPRLRG